MQSCMSSEKELRIYDIIYGFTAAIGQHRSAALTKQLRDSGQNSAMTTTSRFSWEPEPTTLYPSPRTGRSSKRHSPPSPSLAAGCASSRVEDADSQTGSVHRPGRRPLEIFALPRPQKIDFTAIHLAANSGRSGRAKTRALPNSRHAFSCAGAKLLVDLCLVEINQSIRTSKNAKPNTSKRATRSEGFRRMKRSVGLGQR